MGKRGPAPMPTALRLVKGERKSRLNDDEPQPKEGLPLCPLGATEEVHAVWKYTLDQLDHMRIVTLADRDSLYAYCEAVVMHRIASHVIATEGIIAEGMHGGMVKHPALQVQRDSAQMIRAFAQEFGLTPSARSTIKMHVQDEGKVQGAGRLLSG